MSDFKPSQLIKSCDMDRAYDDLHAIEAVKTKTIVSLLGQITELKKVIAALEGEALD